MELSLGWAKALEPNVTEWTHNGFATHSDWTAQVLNIEGNSGFDRFQDSWGPRQVSKSGEAARTNFADRLMGYETVAANQIFKEGIAVSEEYVTRGKYGDIKKDSQDLGKAAIYTINIFGAQPFIEAFTSTSLFYGDAKALASVSHTRPDGGTAQSNASSTGIALTEGNLETGMVAIKQQKGGNGQKLAVGGNLMLMVQEDQEKEAVIITGSQRRSATANNDLNFYLGKIDTMVNPWIGSDMTSLNGVTGTATQWHLLARGEHQITMSYEMRPRYTVWDDKDADAMYTKVKFSTWVGWKNWLATWHSKGAGAAYAS